MSLIHTCRLNLAHPFDYLMALARHPEEVLAHPAEWLPWNFSHALNLADSPPTGQRAPPTIHPSLAA